MFKGLKSICGIFILAALVGFAAKADVMRYRSMAMYIAAESVDNIQPEQERAAARLFQEKFREHGHILTPSQIDDLEYPKYDCLWLHIDSIGKSQGTEKFRAAFLSDKFRKKVKKFYEAGGNIYASKFAIELLYSDGVGIMPDYIRPNVFSSGAGGDSNDIWAINAEIGARTKDDADRSRYVDYRSHPIYAGLTTMKSNQWAANLDPIYNEHLYDVYPMQGKADKSPLHREDHNCMWRLAMKTDDNAKIGIYCGYEGIHTWKELQEKQAEVERQEYAALAWLLNPDGYFRKLRPDVKVEVICPGDIARITDHNNFDCIWVHIDRCGLEPGWDKLPDAFKSQDLIDALKGYVKDGGQLMLTKQATQLLVPLGRVDAKFAPNEYSNGEGGEGFDNWEIMAKIGWYNRDADPSQYYDRSGHAIYEGLRLGSRDGHDVFPLLGTDGNGGMWREDHNCMWNLNGLEYSAAGANTVEKFEKENNAVVLGTWGHVTDYAVAGIVGFYPTIEYRGRIIANGMAAYELNPRNGGNAFTDNIDKLTFNCLRYLVTVTDFSFVSQGPDGVARFEEDAHATVLGTWGQDWNHQAAGIVEFKPTSGISAYAEEATSPELEKLNKNKAPKGTIIANGLGCVQLHHANGVNDYQENVNKLTENIIDYLSPWHERVISGVEDVALSEGGKVFVSGNEICWSGYDRPVSLEVYSVDGRKVMSQTISGDGSVTPAVSGPVIIVADGAVTKTLLR